MRERKPLKERISENNLTFVWLIGMLKKIGINTDKSEMSSAVRGTVSGKKPEMIVEASHWVLDQYEVFVDQLKRPEHE